MKPLHKVTGIAMPIERVGINTDQIFPARFLKQPRSVGYEQFTFHDLRRKSNGALRDDFPLNQAKYKDARFIIGNSSFGIGSSREGAVYTLLDAGFQVLIAPSFGDIFKANCFKNGVLTIELPDDVVAELRREAAAADAQEFEMDISEQTLRRPSGEFLSFQVEPFQKHCLMNGLNEIDLTLEFAADIDAFESKQRVSREWIVRV